MLVSHDVRYNAVVKFVVPVAGDIVKADASAHDRADCCTCAVVVKTDGNAVADAFCYDRLVLASSTYNADVFPFMKTFIQHLTERQFQNRKVGLIENGSWAPLSSRVMRKMLENSKNLTFTDTTVKIFSAVKEENVAEIAALAEELVGKV